MRRAFAITAILGILAVGFASVWFTVSWRQHNPPCPSWQQFKDSSHADKRAMAPRLRPLGRSAAQGAKQRRVDLPARLVLGVPALPGGEPGGAGGGVALLAVGRRAAGAPRVPARVLGTVHATEGSRVGAARADG